MCVCVCVGGCVHVSEANISPKEMRRTVWRGYSSIRKLLVCLMKLQNNLNYH